MTHPKGEVPLHIKPKKFHHPHKDNRLIQELIEIEDPRKPSCSFQRSLVSILFISLTGLLCGAKDWEELKQCAEGMKNWISRYVSVKISHLV